MSENLPFLCLVPRGFPGITLTIVHHILDFDMAHDSAEREKKITSYFLSSLF